MTPTEMLDALEHAIASTPRGRAHRRDTALALRAPTLWGIAGHPLDPDDHGPRYGYTRRQCEALRQVILDAAAADLRAAHATVQDDR